MTKGDLIKAIMKESKLEVTLSDATTLFESTFNVIAKTVKKEERLAVPQFGVFKKTKRKARKGRNPQTGDTIKIKASKSISFKPSPNIKKGL